MKEIIWEKHFFVLKGQALTAAQSGIVIPVAEAEVMAGGDLTLLAAVTLTPHCKQVQRKTIGGFANVIELTTKAGVFHLRTQRTSDADHWIAVSVASPAAPARTAPRSSTTNPTQLLCTCRT